MVSTSLMISTPSLQHFQRIETFLDRLQPIINADHDVAPERIVSLLSASQIASSFLSFSAIRASTPSKRGSNLASIASKLPKQSQHEVVRLGHLGSYVIATF
ncbi:hypothetical protein [Methylopila sp. Yamaguchi]|uniref:hypothetical protein n=1 Tax=Methylopila sp. Yamaguchi TaxID=1437817 RepID=UPI0011AFBB2A|nr:hypothetical protein [Methylopila sp. Yamaguchi]